MIDSPIAVAAREWCDAWNRRDLDAVMTHYADDVELKRAASAPRSAPARAHAANAD